MLKLQSETKAKILLYAGIDVLFMALSLLTAVALWYSGFIPGADAVVQPITEEAWRWLAAAAMLGAGLNIAVLALFRMYNHLWRYAGIDELLKLFAATLITVLALFVMDFFFLSAIAVMPRRVFAAAWLMLYVLTVLSRLGERIARRLAATIGYAISSKKGYKRVMVVGASDAGYELMHNMLHSRANRDKIPVIVVDDDPAKHNSQIMGVRIASGTENIPYLAAAQKIDEIIIAMPEADNRRIKEILEHCTKTDCRLTIVPPVSDVTGGAGAGGGTGGALGVREVNISDLLYRDEVRLDTENIRAYIEGACVLITGGGGSIGSELCRQLLRYRPGRIVIIDVYENNAFDLVQEILEKHNIDIVFRVASIRDRLRMNEIFEEFRPDVVFHAAAHKHVILMEESPAEAVKNNVFGTLNVIRAAIANDCGRFVLISSDKAVRPTNIYGATKRVTELVMQREAARSKGKTQLSAVRFGNVLGSRGSIIPKFMRQIAEGGPVTVYSKEAERFFMTISEACQLVLQAGGLADETTNGHIFVLDMGEPVNIDELAHKIIKLAGFRPGEDIEIIYTGHLPGEKIAEELTLPQEAIATTHHKKIWIAAPANLNYNDFDAQIDRLKTFSLENPGRIGEALGGMGLDYIPLANPRQK